MNLPLTLAINPYDHVRGLAPQGIDLTVLELPIEEIFFRFTRFREWDASEMSFGKTVSLMAEAAPDVVPIPVFPSRVFRHSAIYVGEGSNIRQPKDLEGRRVGIPEWAQTAGIYARGLLQHEYGVDLARIHWHQAGVRQAGRIEKVKLHLGEGVRITPVPDKSLAQMLDSGELDARPRRQTVVRRLRFRGGTVFSQDPDLPDHARRRPAARSLRARPLDRDESLQGLR
jgi:4,5-dihydroxyphthalate decarboxylase